MNRVPSPAPRSDAPSTRPPAPQPPSADPAAAVSITAAQPDPVITQAKRDLDRGLVDTDMHGIAGLDARRRACLVPGPGGRAPELNAAPNPTDPASAQLPSVTIKRGRLSRARYP